MTKGDKARGNCATGDNKMDYSDFGLLISGQNKITHHQGKINLKCIINRKAK